MTIGMLLIGGSMVVMAVCTALLTRQTIRMFKMYDKMIGKMLDIEEEA